MVAVLCDDDDGQKLSLILAFIGMLGICQEVFFLSLCLMVSSRSIRSLSF